MNTDQSQNYFQLLGMPVSFDIDQTILTEHYRDLQKATHPDRFADSSDQERRIAMQRASLVNEAFRTLKNPIQRARYLLDLNGIEQADQQTGMDEEFLMQQMELREALAEARHSEKPQAALMQLMQEIDSTMSTLTGDIARCFSMSDSDALQEASGIVHRMMFIDRLRQEVEEIEDELAISVDD